MGGGWLAFFVGNNPEKTKLLGKGMRRGMKIGRAHV
jgi:hypothetical protein